MMMRRFISRLRLRLLAPLIGAAVVIAAGAARAQVQAPATGSAPSPAAAGATDLAVPMDFPAEGVELRTLVDIVTKRLRIPILYDEQINNKRVMIRVPLDVPESSLLGVLQSALRMKQLAMVDAEQPGWKQIVAAQNLAAVAKPAGPGAAGSALVQVFSLQHADP